MTTDLVHRCVVLYVSSTKLNTFLNGRPVKAKQSDAYAARPERATLDEAYADLAAMLTVAGDGTSIGNNRKPVSSFRATVVSYPKDSKLAWVTRQILFRIDDDHEERPS